MPKSTDQTKFFIKKQSGSAFDAPSASDYLPINSDFTNQANVEAIDRTVITGTGSKLAPVMGQRFTQPTLSHEITGVDYSASETPAVEAVLEGMGMVGAYGQALPVTITADTSFNVEVTGLTSGATANVTVPAKIGDSLLYIDSISGTFDVGGESLEIASSGIGTSSGGIEQQSREYTYVATADIESVSFRLEEDLQKTEGYNGNLTLSLEAPASQILTANMTLTAKFNQDSGKDVYRRDFTPMTDTSSFVDKQPPVFDCARFEIDGVTDLVPSGTFTLDGASDVQIRPNVNQCDGSEGAFIPSRAPTFTFRVEQMPNTQWEYYESWVGQVTSPTYYRYGSEQYNTMHVIMPAFKITNVAPAEENLISYVEISGQLTGVSDDDLKLLFT